MAKKDKMPKGKIMIKNKKASFDYFFIDTYTAGMVLTGTEIKSIRQGKHLWWTHSVMCITARYG